MGKVLRFVAALILVTSACTSGAGSNDQRTDADGSKVFRDRVGCRVGNDLVTRVRRGQVDGAGPDLLYIPSTPSYVGGELRPSHSGPWPYVTRVPLLLYGPPFVGAQGKLNDPATMADVAPTIARIIGFDDWPERRGRPLDRGLVVRSPPRLVVTVVWDGGGRNVLREHQGRWPFLESLIERGTFYSNMTVGSSPSVTPPVHTTLGTGAWPSRHGIHAIKQRLDSGEIGDPLVAYDPSAIRVSTLADLYDQARGNEPVTAMLASSNWHLGMLGHGAQMAGGDKDPVVLIDENGYTFSNEDIYSLPSIDDRPRLLDLIDRLDVSDGKADGAWNGDDLFGNSSQADVLVKKGNPARVKYEEWLLEELIRRGRLGTDSVADLLFVNFKAVDEAGHRWGMSSSQVGTVVEEQDRALRRLVGFLNHEVGRNRWVLVMTADHGQTPFPEESGGWPIAPDELLADANREFDRSDNGVSLAVNATSGGMYLNADEMRSAGVTKGEIARWLASYSVGQSAQSSLPMQWKGRAREQLFDAVLIGRRVAFRNC